jgi:hypothetical protein
MEASPFEGSSRARKSSAFLPSSHAASSPWRPGKEIGSAPIARGHLYWILSNPIYVGRLRHKGQIHDGPHPAIVDIETWDRVQQKLKSQTQIRRTSCPDDQSFLAERLPSFLQETQAYRSKLRNQ